jgi:HEAT repeat protein
MTSSSRVAATVFGAAAVIVALVYVTRPSSQTGATAGSHKPLRPSDRVRARLEQLRAEHPDWTVRSALRARSRVAATPAGGQAQPGAETATSPEMVGGGAPQGGVEDNDALLDEDPDDIPTMKKIALGDKNPDRRLAAVTMLGASEDPDAVPTLAQALSDTDEEVRMAALQALSDFTDEPPVDAIENALNDPDPDIRFEAVGVLADVGGEPARNAIEKALSDPDEDVRNLAQGVLDLESTYEDQAPSGEAQSGHDPATQ